MILSLKRALMVGLCLVFVNACDDSGNGNENGGNNNGENGGNNNDKKGSLKLSAVTTITDVGDATNQIVLDGDNAYIVASMDNVIQRLSLSDLTLQKKFIDLDQGANPYAMAVDGDNIYVACSMNNTIVKTTKSAPSNLTTILDSQDGVDGPTDIIVADGSIYVANSEYDMTTYVPDGSIIRMSTSGNDTHLYETEYRNPTAIYNFNLKNYKGMVTVFTGEYLFDDNYNITGFSKSAIGMSASFDDQIKYDVFLLKDIDVGKMAPLLDGKYFVVGTASTNAVHVVTVPADVSDDYEVRELVIPSETGLAMFMPVAISTDAVVLANFNDDTLYVIDTNNDAVSSWLSGDASAQDAAVQAIVSTKYRLSESSVDIRGPISMAWDASRNHLFVLNSISSTLDVIKIERESL